MLPNEAAVVRALPPQSSVIWGWSSGGCGAWGMQWEMESITEATVTACLGMSQHIQEVLFHFPVTVITASVFPQ